MPQYIILFRYTTQGVQHIKDASKRIDAAKKLFEQNGAKVKAFYAVLGKYDTVCIAEGPDDETMAKLSLQISALGNVKGETMRAFTEDETIKLISQIP